MPIYSYRIGTTQGTLTNLESLSPKLNPPKYDYKPYPKVVQLGSALTRGGGMPVITWTWGFLSKDQWTKLKTYCPGKSAVVYISTKVQDQSYHDLKVVMIWPEAEPKDHGYVLPFILTFKQLEDVTP